MMDGYSVVAEGHQYALTDDTMVLSRHATEEAAEKEMAGWVAYDMLMLGLQQAQCLWEDSQDADALEVAKRITKGKVEIEL